MADFINTIDLLGDDATAKALIERTITEFRDDILYSFHWSALSNCKSLTLVDLPNIASIGIRSFENSSALTTIILRMGIVCALANTSAFDNTPFASGGTGGTVYVPQALITAYQNETNWSTLYAAGTCNFVAIEGSEYE